MDHLFETNINTGLNTVKHKLRAKWNYVHCRILSCHKHMHCFTGSLWCAMRGNKIQSVDFCWRCKQL